MSKGGFSCVMCKNISGRNAGIKFFRFPKNPEMSRLWVKVCNRIIDRTPEELYKNYRVCSAHFNENMYLNDLKTRLLPQAIPILQTTSNSKNTNSDTNIISQAENTGFELDFHEEPEINTNELLYKQMELVESNSVDATMLMTSDEHNFRKEVDSSEILTINKQVQTPKKLSHDTPRKNKLKRKIILLQRENRKLKEQLKSAMNKPKIKETIEHYYQLTEKYLSPSLAAFVKEQAKLNQQLIKGRKYSIQFKQFCVSLYFTGPKTYKMLCKQFILPSPRTLQRSIESLQIPPGFHDCIFEMIKKRIVNFTSLNKLCVICIDEVALKANLYYNINRDEVIGFENLGYKKKFLPACNAAVIMIRGICKSWKQPIAYFLLNSSFNEVDVQNAIEEVIGRLQNIGLKCLYLSQIWVKIIKI